MVSVSVLVIQPSIMMLMKKKKVACSRHHMSFREGFEIQRRVLPPTTLVEAYQWPLFVALGSLQLRTLNNQYVFTAQEPCQAHC